mmetsp:Transcript_41950/g.135738  ORF Transcript_41950/g.135738 Transcript_41950/m.135738 type:complete len:109 (+) Transcript_41950:152-478(+)
MRPPSRCARCRGKRHPHPGDAKKRSRQRVHRCDVQRATTSSKRQLQDALQFFLSSAQRRLHKHQQQAPRQVQPQRAAATMKRTARGVMTGVQEKEPFQEVPEMVASQL